mmetsp:Transcript_44116/g.133697  ORF Transcript_44116/g.133697 Transcript_44116/m.133697 type:complete len:226 (-) Transcript_44116:357-1034(-)
MQRHGQEGGEVLDHAPAPYLLANVGHLTAQMHVERQRLLQPLQSRQARRVLEAAEIQRDVPDLRHEVEALPEGRRLQQLALDLVPLQRGEAAEHAVDGHVLRAQDVEEGRAQGGGPHLGEGQGRVPELFVRHVVQSVRRVYLGLACLVLEGRVVGLAGKALDVGVHPQQRAEPDDRHARGEHRLGLRAILPALRSICHSARVVALLDAQVRQLRKTVADRLLDLR